MQPFITGFRWALNVGFFLPILLLFIGCERAPAAPKTQGAPEVSDKRIVSFSPALTRMIADLGHIDNVVGATPMDKAVGPGVPVVGDLFTVNYEKLLTVHPTDILIQQTRRPIPDRLITLAASHNWRIWSYPLEKLEDITRALDPHPGINPGVSPEENPDPTPGVIPAEAGGNSDLPTPSIGLVVDDLKGAKKLARRLRNQFTQLGKVTSKVTRPQVLVCVYGASTFTAAAPGTFIDEMLTAAGGDNLLPPSSILYPNLTHEQLLKLDPQIILNVSQSQSEATLSLPNQLANRVVSLKEADVLLPSSSIVRMACKVAALIHPTLQAEINTIVIEQVSP